MVERRVARLDDEPVALLRRDRGDELPTAALDGLPHQTRGVAVPDPVVVVGVDDRDARRARGLERRHERAVPVAKRGQQLLAVLVAKVVHYVDEEQRVVQCSVGSSRPGRANE
jgi:hypothetical protein